MFGLPELSRLEARRAELTAQSDALRRGLQADWQALEPWPGWVESATRFGREHRLAALAGAVLSGLWTVRTLRSSSGVGAKFASVWRWLRRLSTLFTSPG